MLATPSPFTSQYTPFVKLSADGFSGVTGGVGTSPLAISMKVRSFSSA